MSRLSTVSRLISLCECSAMVLGSCRASTGSISTAVTLAPRSSSASVSDPRPGPTSRTWSLRLTPDADTMRRTVLASWTKFWPNDFRGRKSSSLARCLYLGSPEKPNRQRAPTLPLHTGHAPQPWRARVTSAIAICSSLVARSALGAYRKPPLPLPCVLIKLHAAVETVAGIDGPITSRFATRQRVPGSSIGHRRHLGARFRAHPEHRRHGPDRSRHWLLATCRSRLR